MSKSTPLDLIVVTPVWCFHGLYGRLPADFGAIQNTLVTMLSLANYLTKRLRFTVRRANQNAQMTVTRYDGGDVGDVDSETELRIQMDTDFCVTVPQDGTFTDVSGNEEGLWVTLSHLGRVVHVCFAPPGIESC